MGIPEIDPKDRASLEILVDRIWHGALREASIDSLLALYQQPLVQATGNPMILIDRDIKRLSDRMERMAKRAVEFWDVYEHDARMQAVIGLQQEALKIATLNVLRLAVLGDQCARIHLARPRKTES